MKKQVMAFWAGLVAAVAGFWMADRQHYAEASFTTDIATESDRPNILWITFEDCSPILGCDGNALALTPRLDAFAAQGVRYTQAFSTSGVCAPSRATLITGCYQTSIGAMHMRTGSRSRAEPADPVTAAQVPPPYEAMPDAVVRCFPELLRAEGYYCVNNVKQDYQFTAPPTVWDENSRQAHWRGRDEGQPFFAVMNFTTTHESQLFDQRRPVVTDRDAVEVPPYLPDTPIVRDCIARQMDNLAFFDGQAGEVLDQLEADGLSDRTIVFIYSDHGSGLARGKRWLYDSGTQVPLLVRFPDGSRAGEVTDRLVSFVDFAPTVLSLCGIDVPAWMQGEAFLGEQASEPRDYVFSARDRTDWLPERIRSVRSGRWRYVWNGRPDLPHFPRVDYHRQVPMVAQIERMADEGELGPNQWQLANPNKPIEELYDLEADPFEIHNLLADPESAERCQAVLVEMRTALAEWQGNYGDLGLMEEAAYLQMIWPDGEQPQTELPSCVLEAVDGERLLTVQCETEGASVGWRVEGADRWNVYTDPVRIPSGVVEVVAHRIGCRRSETVRVE